MKLLDTLKNSVFFKIYYLFILLLVIQIFIVFFIGLPYFKSYSQSLIRAHGIEVLENISNVIESYTKEKEIIVTMTEKYKIEDLKHIVEVSQTILQENYELYKNGVISLEVAQQKSLKALRKVRYNNNDYIWVADKNVVLIAHPNPELQNSSALTLRDTHGKEVVRPMVEDAIANGEGTHSYWWNKIGHENPIKKVSYYKLFKPWNWTIGTGIYLDEIEAISQEYEKRVHTRVSKIINDTKIGKTGYVYIFDKNHHMLFHPNQYILGEAFKTIQNPGTSKTMAQALQEAAHSPSQTLQYNWDHPSDKGNFIYDKVSWMKYYEPLGWYIGSSAYTDELYEPINNYIKNFLFINIFVALLLAFFLYRQLKKLFSPTHEIVTVAQAIQNNDYSQRIQVYQNDEIGVLAKTFNQMTQELEAKQKEETEIKNQLLDAKQSAEKVSKMKSDFLANMSHEIRTPLNGIIGLTNLTLKTELNKKQREYLQKSHNASEALLYIINDILDYSKIEAGKLDLENKPFVFSKMLQNIHDLFEFEANKKNIKLSIESPNLGTVLGDSLRLTQVLTNLVGNAIKFTADGSVRMLVEVSEERFKFLQVKFSIVDTGIGMSKEVLEKLFESFSQADTSITRQFGGTGLGLAISKKLVELMDGKIEVSSEEGAGSRFDIWIPLSKETDATQSESDAYEAAKVTALQTLKNKNILIAEDNKTNQLVIDGILEDLEPNITFANNGLEAVEKIKGNDFDLILMDLQMPVMDGFEASKQIRKFNTKIPIIALSAAVMEEDKRRTSEAGMNAHVAKPIKNEELFKVIFSFI